MTFKLQFNTVEQLEENVKAICIESNESFPNIIKSRKYSHQAEAEIFFTNVQDYINRTILKLNIIDELDISTENSSSMLSLFKVYKNEVDRLLSSDDLSYQDSTTDDKEAIDARIIIDAIRTFLTHNDTEYKMIITDSSVVYTYDKYFDKEFIKLLAIEDNLNYAVCIYDKEKEPVWNDSFVVDHLSSLYSEHL